MSSGTSSAPEVPSLASLHRSFAIALSSAKLSSSGKAHNSLKAARGEKARKKIVEEHFAAWREGCGLAIRKYFPQYIDLALAFPDAVGPDLIGWAEENAWIPLCGQCGVTKQDEFDPQRSHSVVWWMAVAIDGTFNVNLPGREPWCAPKWLAKGKQETDDLVVEWSQLLSARFAGVLTEELEVARVRVAIWQVNQAKSASLSAPATSANSRPKSRLNYRSEVRLAIQTELTRKPHATDLEICRAFDSNGNVDLPLNWQPKQGDREFVKAYTDKRTRPRIEKMISKVRADMRKRELLPLR